VESLSSDDATRLLGDALPASEEEGEDDVEV
jgi:hypothetical protein